MMLHRHFEVMRAEVEQPKPAVPPTGNGEVKATPANDVREGEDIVKTGGTKRKSGRK